MVVVGIVVVIALVLARAAGGVGQHVAVGVVFLPAGSQS
jgi:hypothetical protein